MKLREGPTLERPPSAAQTLARDPASDPAELQADRIGARIGGDLTSVGPITAGTLPEAARSAAETQLGVDLSGTRLHSDTAANAHADNLHALAVTEGSDVRFAKGQLSVESSHHRALLGHELTHVAQQRAAGSVTQQHQNAEPSEDSSALVDAQAEAEAGANQNADLGLRAYSTRFSLLLHRPHAAEVNVDTFIASARSLARTEIDTLNAFPGGADLLLFNTQGFPLTWAARVKDALSLGAEPVQLFTDWMAAFAKLITSGQALGPAIYAHGLPVPFSDLKRLDSFKLGSVDVKATKPSAVLDYALQASQYAKLKYVSVFLFQWESYVGELAAKVAEGSVIPSALDWLDFVSNKQARLRELPARARILAAETNADLEKIQTDALDLKDAAVFVGLASALSGLMGILSGLEDASIQFDAALAAANGLVAGSAPGVRINTALRWAWDNDYFGGAGIAMGQALLAHGPEVLAETSLIVVAGFIPGVNIALAVYLGLTVARDVVGLLDELGATLAEVMSASSVAQLQKASARLAQVIDNGAAVILTVLIAKGIGAVAGKIRARAAALRAEDASLTEAAAEEKALRELSAEERAPLEQGPAKIAAKFKEFGGACALGSITCQVQLPQHILDEAGAYPAGLGVPMPRGPFSVQKSALTETIRRPRTLRNLARANRKLWPEFDRALAEAEARGRDWVFTDGKAWEVHHIKPVNMGGGTTADNLVPLPKAVHLAFNAYWDRVYQAFRRRFTPSEWEEIYGNVKNISGSEVPVNRP